MLRRSHEEYLSSSCSIRWRDQRTRAKDSLYAYGVRCCKRMGGVRKEHSFACHLHDGIRDCIITSPGGSASKINACTMVHFWETAMESEDGSHTQLYSTQDSMFRPFKESRYAMLDYSSFSLVRYAEMLPRLLPTPDLTPKYDPVSRG